MIICPNCRQQELNGAIYCSKCGAQLIDAKLSTHKIMTPENEQLEINAVPLQPHDLPPSQSRISLHLVESGQILPLADRLEFTLGRSAEGQPIVPDIDLSQYNAFTNGVSRLHAALKLIDHRVVLIDLGSSNGTFINGARTAPYIETLVGHGDLVSLGKLSIQVLIK